MGDGKIFLMPGRYVITANNENIITLPSVSYSSPPMIIEYEGAFSGMFTVANGQDTPPANYGVVIDLTGISAPATVPGNVFFCPSVPANNTAINNIIPIVKNIQIVNAVNSNYSGINFFYASACGVENVAVTVNAGADTITAPTGTAFGIRFPMAFNNNMVYGCNFFVQGYAYGVIAAGNTTLLNFYVQSCGYGVLTTANNSGYYEQASGGTSTSTYPLSLLHYNIQECTYSIANLDPAGDEFVVYGHGNFESSGVPPMSTTYNIQDPNGNLRGIIYYNNDSNTGVDQAALINSGSYVQVKRTSGPVLALNTTVTLTSGTVYVNPYNVPVMIYVPITFNPTSTAAATVQISSGTGTGASSNYLVDDSEPAGITVGRIRTYPILVPAGWNIYVVVTNATIGTAYVREIP
jgi:hypothetical protein